MRRIAAHYIYCGRVYRMHYLELDEENRLRGIYPLTEEIAGTAFYDGILVPLPFPLLGNEKGASGETFLFSFQGTPAFPRKEAIFEALAERRVAEEIEPGVRVRVFLINGISLAASELGADNGGGNGHVQRL